MSKGFEWRDVMWNDFETHYPRQAAMVTECYQSGLWELTLYLKDGTRYIYNHRFDTIRALLKADACGYAEDVWSNEFASRLKFRMKENGMNQKTLADRIGVSQALISKYITGKAIPNSYQLSKIARVLGCSVSELIDFDI